MYYWHKPYREWTDAEKAHDRALEANAREMFIDWNVPDDQESDEDFCYAFARALTAIPNDRELDVNGSKYHKL